MVLTTTSLQQFFERYQNISKYIVAFSGGLDSTVLLHIMNGLDLPVHAVHINHHLQQDCEKWQENCKNICTTWGIPLSIKHAQIDTSLGKSLEESARDARYKLLSELIEAKHSLVTAHHKNDLAETVLLQLLRGSGPAGLSAMSTEQNLSVGKHLRPLLNFSRTDLLEYAQHHSLMWIEDASNASLDFDRNYLRKEIMPKLLGRWPSALQTISRAANLQVDAMSCLRELATLDMQAAKTNNSKILNLKPLQNLRHERLNNVLRGWIQDHAMRVPSKKLLSHIVTDIVYKKDMQSSPVQTWADGEVRRYHDQLYLMEPLSAHDPSQKYQWKIDQPLYIESLKLKICFTDLHRLVSLPAGVEELTVRFRSGGERLKPFGTKHHRSLKNLFQEADVPPWERDRIPLLYYENQLISVIGYWNGALSCETFSPGESA